MMMRGYQRSMILSYASEFNLSTRSLIHHVADFDAFKVKENWRAGSQTLEKCMFYNAAEGTCTLSM